MIFVHGSPCGLALLYYNNLYTVVEYVDIWQLAQYMHNVKIIDFCIAHLIIFASFLELIYVGDVQEQLISFDIYEASQT